MFIARKIDTPHFFLPSLLPIIEAYDMVISGLKRLFNVHSGSLNVDVFGLKQSFRVSQKSPPISIKMYCYIYWLRPYLLSITLCTE